MQEWEWNKNSYVGSSIVRHFHESIWEAHVGKNISPVECWNNKELLEKTVKNRMIYSSRLSSQSIVDGFNVSKIAPKVSVFNPMSAKYLIKTYLNEFSEVFDPFSGFSGRMLGCCALGKKYVGQDINTKHVIESNRIIDYLRLNASVKEQDIFIDQGEYECLFTCPPYGLKEIWNEHETNYTCDMWIAQCITRYDCKKYLFVVDSSERYKDYIIGEITNSSHFGNRKEYIVLITI